MTTAAELSAEIDRLARQLADVEQQFPGTAARVLARALELNAANRCLGSKPLDLIAEKSL